MNRPATGTPRRVPLLATPPHRCSYLPGREATTVFLEPALPRDPALFAALAAHGFRRSGEHVYRPACRGCSACVPIRVPVEAFRPRRRQRRVWRRNRDLTARTRLPAFDEEHFDLYRRYLGARHRGGGMDDPAPDQFLEFLTSSWSDTVFVEFREGDGALVAVAVTDRFADALSAVYTFFDPDAARRSPGVYTVLWQILEARRLGLRHLYLGYWIADCAKMAYKSEYRPHERLVDGRWVRFGEP